jgi:hypothetical protein
MEPLAHAPCGKMERKLAIAERALADLDRWRGEFRDGLKAVPYVESPVGPALQGGSTR